MKKKFFTKFDWAAFWVATIVSFGVYFYTLGPSVGLEDSGELATASAHLGVPHPPGYPFWTFCTWIFCKIFSSVTYMGHPNPVWAVSCCSAFFGALAAGCMAMLISRSAADLIYTVKKDSLLAENDSSTTNWLSFLGGVSGALAFAFSPVEWSQSTIVEIYSLNSLFLVLVFLLSYRWMRRPTDKTLWFAAFVFGLGLTNYQVLLFAIVPLGIIILLKNVKLFRDFALFIIPVLLTYQVLKTADYQRAKAGMSSEVLAKAAPVGVSNLEYAVIGSNLEPLYFDYWSNPKAFEERKKSLDHKLSVEKEGIKKLKEEGKEIPSAAYKACLDYEAQLKMMISVQRNAYKVDKKTLDKLDKISEAQYLSNIHKQGLEDNEKNKESLKNVKRILNNFGCGESDLVKHTDGKYHLSYQAYEKIKPLSEMVSKTKRLPSQSIVIISILVFFGFIISAFVLKKRNDVDTAVKTVLAGGASAAFLLFLAGTLFARAGTWSGVDAEQFAPTANPIVYVLVGVFILLSSSFALAASFRDDASLFTGKSKHYIIASAGFALLAIISVLAIVPSIDGIAELFGYFNREGLPSYANWRMALSDEIASCPDLAVKAELIKELNQPTNAYVSWLPISLLLVIFISLSIFIKKGLCFAIPVAGFQIALFLLLSRGAVHGLTHPSTWWFWWPLVWNFVVLALVWSVLPYGKSVAGAAFFTQLGVAFYAYMPIVSELRNPPMNWGYPRTWEGFKHAITRGQYEEIRMPDFGGISAFFTIVKNQILYYFSELKIQFTDFLLLLTILPLACWRVTVRKAGTKSCFFALHFSLFFAVLLAVRACGFTFGFQDAGRLQKFDVVVILAMALPAIIGMMYVIFNQFIMRPAVVIYRFYSVSMHNRRKDYIVACVLILLSLAILSLLPCCKPGGSVKYFALFVSMTFIFAIAVTAVPFIIKKRLEKSSFCLSFDSDNNTQHWILALGACFFVMTVPLILLANVKGDVQDGFIQKVKFISSYAMVAIWIGYGIILLASFFRFFFSKMFVCVFLMCLAGIIPILKNYTDEEVVLKYGGSEQNNHSFGWQFGAYQLDGAKAIRAQITEDEEPLPDPDYPPPMEPYSILFGGTDPGRFVPTYMIYGANFRPDIYLITQNALADGTYMAVERDLYGDEIWIPSEEDSAVAFQRYADRKGKSAKNGRLQVTGALEVMEINAELAKMMHEHDKTRHAFYIEESYAMEWMYPKWDNEKRTPVDGLVSPHGLVMKINPEPTACDPELVKKDRDFWDWYTRRLIDDPMYRRDFAAQKSFSKLRATLAKYYRMNASLRFNQLRYSLIRYNGDKKTILEKIDSLKYFLKNAVASYSEARILYPISPDTIGSYISFLEEFNFLENDLNNWVKELSRHKDMIELANTINLFLNDVSNNRDNLLNDLIYYIDEKDPNSKLLQGLKDRLEYSKKD